MKATKFLREFFGWYTPSDLLVFLAGTLLVVKYHDVVGVGLLGWTFLTILQIYVRITQRQREGQK